MKRVQQRKQETESFGEGRQKLKLQKDDEGICVCQGRIQGHYPVYLPDNELTEKIVAHAHKLSCHGGVGMTMAKFQEKFWIPRLTSQTSYQTFQHLQKIRAVAVANPPTGNLPKDHAMYSRWQILVLFLCFIATE